MSNKINCDDLDIINLSLKGLTTFKAIKDIEALPKDAIMSLIEDHLTNLIGFDKEKDDIDDLGERVDDVISKLLTLLGKREEM
jgi:hypothetical protein